MSIGSDKIGLWMAMINNLSGLNIWYWLPDIWCSFYNFLFGWVFSLKLIYYCTLICRKCCNIYSYYRFCKKQDDENKWDKQILTTVGLFFVIWLLLIGFTDFVVHLFVDLKIIENDSRINILHLLILLQWALIIIPFGKKVPLFIPLICNVFC